MKAIGAFILFLLLSGCTSTEGQIERGMRLRSELLNAEQCRFDVEITADYGDRIHNFFMRCETDDKGDLRFLVTAPESISGITGMIDEEGGKLTFGDTALHFEQMADEQLSPVSAPWILIKTLRSGYLTSACEEEAGIRLTIDDSYEEDALTLDIWLDEEDLPSRAEILYDGRRILTLLVKNMSFS